MNWSELLEELLSSAVPPEIMEDEQRLKDYLKGAKDLCTIWSKSHGDDLK